MADSLIRRYNVPSDVIDSSRLRFVVRAMHEVAVHWNAMGHQLKIGNLEKIKQDYETVSRCLIAMADSLLKGRFIEQPGTPATWRTIVEVVYAPAGGNNPRHAHTVAANLIEFQTFCPDSIAKKNADSTSFIDLDVRKMVEEISAELVHAAARWFEIGALLGLPLNTLTMIKDENHPSATDWMRRVIAEWLNKADMLELEPPSWQVLVDVVAHGAGGEDPELAQKLAIKSKEKTAIPLQPVHGAGGASQAASGYSGNGQPPASSSAESTAEHQAPATHTPPPDAHVEPAPATAQERITAQGELQTADNQQNSVLQPSQLKHSQHAAAQLTGIQMLYDIEDATGDTRKTYTVESWKMPKSTKAAVAARPVIMAILDSGINKDHKAFDASDRIIPIKLPGQSDTNDETGHGTICAGIAAGMPYEEIRQASFLSRFLGKTDKFLGGVAPNVKLIVYKVTTAGGNYDGLIPALGDLGALTAADIPGMGGKAGPLIDVVSMSFGNIEENPNITDAINLLPQETICVAAAGNDGGLTDKCPFPAKYDNVIAVGACTDSGDRWKYTTRATDKRVYLAPGVDILAPSHGSTTELVARSGTSLAAPAVAGLIARLIDWTYAYCTRLNQEEARRIHNINYMKKVLDLMVNEHGILEPNKVFLSADLFKEKVETCLQSNLDY